MRRIFLDVGAANGISVEFFREHHPEADEFEIYSFEPFSTNIKSLLKYDNVHVIPKAAWIKDGTTLLYIGKPKSCTFFADKSTGRIDSNNSVIVPTIDLARYILEHFESHDEIWIKINIEGAEYELIPHLYNHGLIPWFDRMYVKWHITKIASITQQQHDYAKSLVPNAFSIWKSKSILPFMKVRTPSDVE